MILIITLKVNISTNRARRIFNDGAAHGRVEVKYNNQWINQCLSKCRGDLFVPSDFNLKSDSTAVGYRKSWDASLSRV